MRPHAAPCGIEEPLPFSFQLLDSHWGALWASTDLLIGAVKSSPPIAPLAAPLAID
jgi:hypothetical protein